MREKLKEDIRYPGAKRFIDKIRDVEPNSKIEAPGLDIHFLETRHSTLDTCSLRLIGRLVLIRCASYTRPILSSILKEYEDGVRTVESIYGVFKGARPDFLFHRLH